MESSLAKRLFEERVRPRIREVDGCWLTDLKDNGNGYVYIQARPHRIGIHRLAHIAFVGPLKRGENACHTCDVPGCCNPGHLFNGTQAANLEDMDAKGRRRGWNPKGERNPARKLSAEQVQAIRAAPGMQKDLAVAYGVSKSLISAIKRGEAWR